MITSDEYCIKDFYTHILSVDINPCDPRRYLQEDTTVIITPSLGAIVSGITFLLLSGTYTTLYQLA